MARNLRRNALPADRMLVYDINVNSTKRFVGDVRIAASSVDGSDNAAEVDVAETPRSLAEKSVSCASLLSSFPFSD